MTPSGIVQRATDLTLTVEHVRDLIDYNPLTGEFTWLTREVHSRYDRIWNTQNAGKIAGTPAHHGYRAILIYGNRFYAHRLAFFHVTGTMPPHGVDHKDGDTTNNKFDNLRPATQAQNRANTKAKHGTSRYKGVSFHAATGKWQASLSVKHRRVWLGLHESEQDAAAAYNRGAVEHFGEFARIVIPALPY